MYLINLIWNFAFDLFSRLAIVEKELSQDIGL